MRVCVCNLYFSPLTSLDQNEMKTNEGNISVATSGLSRPDVGQSRGSLKPPRANRVQHLIITAQRRATRALIQIISQAWQRDAAAGLEQVVNRRGCRSDLCLMGAE